MLLCSTCLAVGEDADVVAIQHRRHQLRNVPKNLLLGAVWPKHSVKLKALHSPDSSWIPCDEHEREGRIRALPDRGHVASAMATASEGQSLCWRVLILREDA